MSGYNAKDYADAILTTLAGAGICTPEKGYESDGGPSQARADLQKLSAKAKHLEAKLKDAESSAGRWATRMMLLEDRFAFAMEVLQGKHDELDHLHRRPEAAKPPG